MSDPAIHLDPATLARAQQLAEARRCSVEELVRALVAESQLPERELAGDLVGFLADEPDLADRIMEDVYRTRDTASLRARRNA